MEVYTSRNISRDMESMKTWRHVVVEACGPKICMEILCCSEFC